MAANPKTGEPSWKWRRIVALANIVVSWLVVIYMIDNSDTRLNSDIVVGVLWLQGAIVLFYTGFATSQDIAAILATRSGRPYADTVVSAPAPPADQTVVVAQTNVQQPKAEPKPPPGFAEG